MSEPSWCVPLREPSAGLIDLLYFCIPVICYLFTFGMIWETSSCVFYKSPTRLRSLPRASFLSRALSCLSTWICAIGSRFPGVCSMLIRDRLPCRSTSSEHCNWKQHTVIVAKYSFCIKKKSTGIKWFPLKSRWTEMWWKRCKIANLGVCLAGSVAKNPQCHENTRSLYLFYMNMHYNWISLVDQKK